MQEHEKEVQEHNLIEQEADLALLLDSNKEYQEYAKQKKEINEKFTSAEYLYNTYREYSKFLEGN